MPMSIGFAGHTAIRLLFASRKKNTTEIAAIAARLIDTSLYRPLSPHCIVIVRENSANLRPRLRPFCSRFVRTLV